MKSLLDFQVDLFFKLTQTHSEIKNPHRLQSLTKIIYIYRIQAFRQSFHDGKHGDPLLQIIYGWQIQYIAYGKVSMTVSIR